MELKPCYVVVYHAAGREPEAVLHSEWDAALAEAMAWGAEPEVRGDRWCRLYSWSIMSGAHLRLYHDRTGHIYGYSGEYIPTGMDRDCSTADSPAICDAIDALATYGPEAIVSTSAPRRPSVVTE